MNNDSARKKKLYDITSKQIADQETPLIANAWYVAGTSSELKPNELVEREILSKSVVLFRDEAGIAVAMQNRCCHRSFPLSEGKLEDGKLRCGYHGLLYDRDGNCIEIPMVDRKPKGICLRTYPVVEKAGLIWIWMGDDGKDAMAEFPLSQWLENPDNWSITIGYMSVAGSYVHMHENLLDLSHLSYLHETTFGTPEYAVAPVEFLPTDKGLYEVWREVECILPPIYAKPLGWEGKRAVRRSGSQYCAPGLHVNTGKFSLLNEPFSDDSPMVRVAQLLTPESQYNTHYWFAVARNFAAGDVSVDNFMLGQQRAAFEEDAHAVKRISTLQRLEHSAPDFYEIDIPTDKAGLAMRKHLKQLANHEVTME